jgi:DNA-directed RNA polymerase-3 subunit RPC5
MQPLQGGLSAVRREMLLAIRTEDEEVWEDLEFCDGEVGRSYNIPKLNTDNIHRLLNQKKLSKLYFRGAQSH